MRLETDGVSWSTLLDKLYWQAHKVQQIHVCCDCEPLLEPRLTAILACCKQFNRHAETIIHTNLLHYDPKVWSTIIKRNLLDTLIVHVDGNNVTQDHVNKLVKLKAEMGWRKPKICPIQKPVISVINR